MEDEVRERARGERTTEWFPLIVRHAGRYQMVGRLGECKSHCFLKKTLSKACDDEDDDDDRRK